MPCRSKYEIVSYPFLLFIFFIIHKNDLYYVYFFNDVFQCSVKHVDIILRHLWDLMIAVIK